MVTLPSQRCVVRKVAIIEDKLHTVDVKKAVLPWRCILQTGKLGI